MGQTKIISFLINKTLWLTNKLGSPCLVFVQENHLWTTYCDWFWTRHSSYFCNNIISLFFTNKSMSFWLISNQKHPEYKPYNGNSTCRNSKNIGNELVLQGTHGHAVHLYDNYTTPTLHLYYTYTTLILHLYLLNRSAENRRIHYQPE